MAWAESNKAPSGLLQVLCKLGQESPNDEFNIYEIAEKARDFNKRNCQWGATILNNAASKPDQARKRLNEHWDNLIELLESKREGIEQKLKDSGISATVKLVKQEGGGSGYSNTYKLSVIPVSSIADYPPLPGCDFRYLREDVFKQGSITKKIFSAYRINGLRKVFLFSSIIISVLSAYFLLFLVYISIWGPLPSPKLAFSSIVLGLIGYLTIAPIYSLPERVIVSGPWWISLFNFHPKRHLLLEWRSDKHEDNCIELTSYMGADGCQFCDGKVFVKPGRREFKGRLIGQCERAPNEHVFSFDHVTRSGKFLR